MQVKLGRNMSWVNRIFGETQYWVKRELGETLLGKVSFHQKLGEYIG